MFKDLTPDYLKKLPEPIAAASPPMPVMDATAFLGNMSETVVYRFADQA